MRDGLDPGTSELFSDQAAAWGFLRPWSDDPAMEAQVRLLDKHQCRRFLSPAALPKRLEGQGRIDPANLPDLLSRGDTLFVERLALLQTGLHELLTLLQRLRDRNIRLVAINEGIDSQTASGGFVLAAAAFLAKCDQHWRQDRRSQRAAARAARGRLGGRPQALDDALIADIRSWIAKDPDQRNPGKAAKHFGLPRSTLYRHLR